MQVSGDRGLGVGQDAESMMRDAPNGRFPALGALDRMPLRGPLPSPHGRLAPPASVHAPGGRFVGHR